MRPYATVALSDQSLRDIYAYLLTLIAFTRFESRGHISFSSPGLGFDRCCLFPGEAWPQRLGDRAQAPAALAAKRRS